MAQEGSLPAEPAGYRSLQTGVCSEETAREGLADLLLVSSRLLSISCCDS